MPAAAADDVVKIVRPWLYAKQREAIFSPSRIAVIEASTKAGKTIGCISWLIEQAFGPRGGENRQFYWVAPWYGTTLIAFRRTKRALRKVGFRHIDNPPTVWLPNGSVISFRSAEKPDGLYGDDVQAAVLDEASRMREEAWHAIRSTVTATRGPVRIIGNVKGRKNWAYRLARKAQAGEPGYSYAKLTAYDAAAAIRPNGKHVIDPAEIEQAKRDLPEQVFRELYLAEPSDDGGNPFGLAAIAKCIRPISAAPVVTWGWDLAKSVDWTVGIGLDDAKSVAGFERWQRSWRETMAWMRAVTGSTDALVDATGVGDPIVEQLRATHPNFEPFVFTSRSKQQLMEGLALAIQQGEVSFPDGVIRAELEEFEYVYTRTGVTYSAPEGAHDDCVAALALAVERARRGSVKAEMW